MRIVVHGQQAFGRAVLERLLERGDDVVAVCTVPDEEGRPVDPLKALALGGPLGRQHPTGGAMTDENDRMGLEKVMTKNELERALRRALAARDRAQLGEAALVDVISRALATLDDLALSPFDQRHRAAAILERAIGRQPRRTDVDAP
jgi:hypothetical protein